MGLLYTDEVPTIPGFYFQRQRGGVRVIELPYCGQWPKHWRDKRQDGINAVGDEHTRAAAEALPDSSWIVEWAGPIDHPEN